MQLFIGNLRMPKLAANLTMMFNECEFLERFGMAAKSGFNGVEYLFPYEFDKQNISDELLENDLEQILFDLPAGDWGQGDRGVAVDPERKKEFEEGVAVALEYADILNCSRLTCLAGMAPAGISDFEARSTLTENLAFAAPLLGNEGITLLLEPINTIDIPGFWLNSTHEAISVINEVKQANLLLQYDIYHMQIMEGNLMNTIKDNIDVIGHFQLADNPGRNEPGTGEINYDYLLKSIDDLGYRDWIGCEYKPASDTLEGLKWARKYLI